MFKNLFRKNSVMRLSGPRYHPAPALSSGIQISHQVNMQSMPALRLISTRFGAGPRRRGTGKLGNKFESTLLHDTGAAERESHLSSLDLKLTEVDRSGFSRSRQLPDFVVPSLESALPRSKLPEVTEEMAKKRHPLEYQVADARAREDPYRRLTNSSLLVTNFPKDIDVTKKFIHDLCLKHEKAAIINKIDLVSAV